MQFDLWHAHLARDLPEIVGMEASVVAHLDFFS